MDIIKMKKTNFMKELKNLSQEQKDDTVNISIDQGVNYETKTQKIKINVVPKVLSRQFILEECYFKRDKGFKISSQNKIYSFEYILIDETDKNIDTICRYDLKALMEIPETANLIMEVIEEYDNYNYNYYLLDKFVIGEIFKSGKAFKIWNKKNKLGDN